MKTISVNASRCYEVIIGSGLLNGLGERLRKLIPAKKAAVISDSNVWPIYGPAVLSSLTDAGFAETPVYVFPAGEQSKNGATFLEILEFLAQHQLTRSDCLIALGGGVVGDITGFAAATFLRGIDFVQIPTTLLAAVDSSVGGKTAIDLKAGKNLAGAFYQPSLVLCDTDTLNTLPEAVFRDGCAEVIKYGVLYDTELFAHLSQFGPDFDRETVIARCVELKRDVVAQDEFDRGQRQKLNLGHTLGHGIEANSNFTLTHGQAVSIGMAMVCRSAAKQGLLPKDVCRQIITLLQQFGLPVTTAYSAEAIYRSALSDKKRSGGTVNLIVPRMIGNCSILPTAVEELKLFIEAGL